MGVRDGQRRAVLGVEWCTVGARRELLVLHKVGELGVLNPSDPWGAGVRSFFVGDTT